MLDFHCEPGNRWVGVGFRWEVDQVSLENLDVIRDFTIHQPGFSNHTTVGGEENLELVVFGTTVLWDEIDNDSEPITMNIIE
jgi:hypothetical protein